jgi:uncharacterized protein (TIGR03382 family)
LLFFFLVSARSEAAPIMVSFSDVIQAQGGPLDGLILSGNFSYDDPYGITGCAPSCTFGSPVSFPMLSLSLHVGTNNYNLSHSLPGAHVMGPLGSLFWGPFVTIAPAFLPSGITSMALSGDAVVRFQYSTSSNNYCCYEPPLTFTLLPPTHSVPGPGSLAVCVSALLALVARRRFSS